MPEMPAARRASGGQVTGAAPVDRASLLPWLNGEWLAREVPDQSRYGLATSDPLNREGPGWRKGDHGLPVLRKGWHYDRDAKRTTVIVGGVADPDRDRDTRDSGG